MTIEEAITAEWFSLLNNMVSYGPYVFPVYRTNAPIGESGPYILLRKEGGSFTWNKAAFFRSFTLIVEIVTIFGTIINDKFVDEIDEDIRGIVFNSPASNNLNVTGLIKVDPGVPTYMDEDDGSNKYYRKITRFTHQVASEVA